MPTTKSAAVPTYPAPNDGADPFAIPSAYVHEDVQDAGSEPSSTVVVSGRNVDIPDHFRVHVAHKISRLERFDQSTYRFDVKLAHEPNRRQAKRCEHVEITALGKGPVIRGEGCSENFYAALELAIDKLQTRLRRSSDRRRVHHGKRRPISVAEATADIAHGVATANPGDPGAASRVSADEDIYDSGIVDAAGPGHVVRIKDHPAQPMTVDDALYEMELVGHDFFLFHDKESDKPSVVYRRHAFDYGLIRLA